MSETLKLAGVAKTYGAGKTAVEVLKGVDLTINAGEIVALVAPSGAGKPERRKGRRRRGRHRRAKRRHARNPAVEPARGDRMAALRHRDGRAFTLHSTVSRNGHAQPRDLRNPVLYPGPVQRQRPDLPGQPQRDRLRHLSKG